MTDDGILGHLKALDALRTQRPAGNLYHYTNQRGLLGIITTKVLWATHVRYLNDSAEFSLAVDLAKRVLEEELDTEQDPEKRVALEELKYGADYPGIPVCVCSFSEARDLLSQWRAYAGQGSGLALGFTYPVLADIAARNSFFVAPMRV